MKFLQPFMLAAIPLIALPIIIHLINQRRYQTMQWGAMQFLLQANKMSRGYARLRQWLILACRTLAVAGLIFAACRPLASGWLGLVSGSRADTTIVLLDRSPSMLQQGRAGALTKLGESQQQLVDTLSKLGSNHWVLIESNRSEPQTLESIERLQDLPEADGSSASADILQMLQAAVDYIRDNKTGRTEIWICSDLRANDWRHRSAQWQEVREFLLAFPQSVRIHIFGFAQLAPGNISVAVTELQRDVTETGSELTVSLQVSREAPTPDVLTIPVQFEIAGASSQTEIELTGREYQLHRHRIPIEPSLERGWGKVSIPADANVADGEFYFAFDKPMPRRTVLVLEDSDRAMSLLYAAAVSPNPSVVCAADLFEPSQMDAVAWEEVALVLWQAPLPDGDTAELLRSFTDRGGRIIFFPPTVPTANAFQQVSWDEWREPDAPTVPATWRSQQDLLANTLSGAALPLGEVRTLRYCPPRGDLTTLATLDGGDPLLSRLATDAGGIYFFSTTSYPTDSSLAENGAVLYVAVQRALAEGAMSLGQARQLVAGAETPQSDQWRRVAGPDSISTDYAFHAGVYENGEQLVAVNRSADQEDHATVLTGEQVNGLFEGLDFSLIENQMGQSSSLVQEIWRVFLLAMMLALFGEALLCVPKLSQPRQPQKLAGDFQHADRAADLTTEGAAS